MAPGPLLALLLVPFLLAALSPAVAAPAATLAGSRVDHFGVQQSGGVLAGALLRSEQALPATFLVDGTDVRLHWENLTYTQALQAGVGSERDRGDAAYPQATLRSSPAAEDMEFLVLPVEGHPPPTVTAASRSLSLARSATPELAETAHVDSSRPVLRGAVGGTAHASSVAVDSLEVRGAFALSVWSWDFVADDGRSQRPFPTGVHQSDVVRNPATGDAAASRDFSQVVQVRVGNGTLRIDQLAAAAVDAYAPEVSVASVGHFALSGAVGLLDAAGAGDLSGETLAGDGTLASAYSGGAGGLDVRLRSFEGSMTVGGRPVDLGGSGPLRQAGAGGGGLSAPATRWSLGAGLWLLAIGAAMLAARGPVRRARFNRIEGRFDAKDYGWVLERIEPFTGWRRFRRRAAVLKAVSLLSLENYREAALYLETLDPRRGPDVATRRFLQAFAAAGLGQDDVAIEHLGECFRLDPSYIREARFVPMLAGYLPYFSISPEFA